MKTYQPLWFAIAFLCLGAIGDQAEAFSPLFHSPAVQLRPSSLQVAAQFSISPKSSDDKEDTQDKGDNGNDDDDKEDDGKDDDHDRE